MAVYQLKKEGIMNYTKGEWYLEEATGLILSIPGDTDSPIVVASIGGGAVEVTPKPLREMMANAQLIASAPDLYEALKKIIKSGNVYPAGGFDDAFEALAKAGVE